MNNKLLELKILNQLEIKRAQNNFWKFCVYMDSEFFTDSKIHLKQIAEVFQLVIEGSIKNIMLSLPPRAGKSYVTSLFCAYLTGKKSDGSIMRNSYAAELAEKFSYDIRQIVQTDRYLKVFPHVKLKQDKKAINDWAITEAKQTSYFCSGVGGAITGKGCKNAGILDDPIKNIEDALSETMLEKTWNWYTSTHLSRFESGCPNIHIATRWSKKDPIGRIKELNEVINITNISIEQVIELAKQNPNAWYEIVIPALDENGKSFCEEIKTTYEYMEIKKITDDFIWEAEFMQNPVESKGLLFPSNELKRFNLNEIATKNPDGIVGFTDTADQGVDFLCSVIGKKYGIYTYITDVIFTQDGVEITEPLVAQMLIDTKCDIMTIESNSGGKSFATNVRKLINGKYGCSIIPNQTTSNKETRILMSAGYIKEHFYFRDDYPIGSDYDKFMRQLTSYIKMGKNKHDDGADACTGLAEYVKNLPINQIVQNPIYNFKSEMPKPDPFVGGEIDMSYINYGGE